MKILELRFKNLNSLYGEWKIDFTHPEYASRGLFALTGPTGAGKSTVLDALCLALYGVTPRQRRINKSGNEIMSRQTGECYAEVLFEGRDGSYRCRWDQRRARKSPGGKLQDQEHQIIDASTGRPMETKKSLTLALIEEKTGMDFDRFTRSVLLAQGGFDTFLKADSEQKSRLLEQITGTEIYSHISRAVHERKKQEEERLTLLRAETEGIDILEEEALLLLREEGEAKKKEEARLIQQKSRGEEAAAWLKEVARLKAEREQWEAEEKDLQISLKEFLPQRERLELAEKAALSEGVYAALKTLRKEQEEDRKALKEEENALPEQEEALKKALTKVEEAGKTRKEERAKREKTLPLLRQVRDLDRQIEERRISLKQEEEALRRGREKLEKDREGQLREQKKRAEREKDREQALTYLRENGRDEWLPGGFSALEEQLNRLISHRREIRSCHESSLEARSALEKAEKTLASRQAQKELRTEEEKDFREKLKKERTALEEHLQGRLLREYRSEKDALQREMILLAKIAGLEEERSKLQPGSPCPLCGSTDHPYAKGAVPDADREQERINELDRIISRAEEREESCRRAEGELERAGENLRNSEKELAAALYQRETAQTTLNRLEGDRDKLTGEENRLEEALLTKLRPLGENALPEDLSALGLSLKKRLEIWQAQVNLKEEGEREIALIEGEIQRLHGTIQAQEESQKERTHSGERLRKDLFERERERKDLFGSGDPEEEERRLDEILRRAEEEEKSAGERHAQKERRLNDTRTRRTALKERLTGRAEELEREETAFSLSLGRTGFSEERDFLLALLSREERSELTRRQTELDRELHDLQVRLKDRTERLAREEKRGLTEESLQAVEASLTEQERGLTELRRDLAALNHRLEQNRVAEEKIAAQKVLLAAQQKECLRWTKLHDLIGSADGKKFRTFAQGLTFEQMVSYANDQLKKMTGRYLLIRDEEHPLELNVADNYQAGEIRSTGNLSGGESFIISLSLALGLSRMTSRQVRVDSLFLDEGFGTLDEEALETALETLSGLQQEGKLIGIISHVSALKERIATQIEVTPLSGGRSSLRGPGCEKLKG
ncbi:MAG: AAA family ATPase [Spirochaetales bacterium]|nr:AAA family ATPase [Spirochaetales bacterium]